MAHLTVGFGFKEHPVTAHILRDDNWVILAPIGDWHLTLTATQFLQFEKDFNLARWDGAESVMEWEGLAQCIEAGDLIVIQPNRDH